MADSVGKPIIFVVPGQRTPEADATRGGASTAQSTSPIGGRVKESVRVGVSRGDSGAVRVTAVPGADVVVLHIAGGPDLILHPETARDLILAQSGGRPGGRTRGATAPDVGAVQVPAQLQWRGPEQVSATRSGGDIAAGGVTLSALEVITDLVTDKAADLLAGGVASRVDAQVENGVYKLERGALPPLKGTQMAATPNAGNGAQRLLVFLHGTFSNTSGTFGKLWGQHASLVRRLVDTYHDAVYALDHPTLGASPIANALTLARWLPTHARVHLVTHSRGGLVAEVLARVCGNTQLGEAEIRSFTVEQRQEMKALATVVAEKQVRVERVVRVACPARGTLLASKRLDAYISVFKWALDLAGVPVAPQVLDFLKAVAQRRTDPAILPGLAAQIPDSPLVQWLHSARNPIPGELRVVAGDIASDSVWSWIKTMLADGFFWTDNDFVVQTRSMYGGSPRAEGATFLLDRGGKVSHFAYFENPRTAAAVVDAIVRDDPSEFRVVGPLSWAGKESAGDRAALAPADGTAATEKPALFVLPGMLGSNLKIDGEPIWLTSRLAGGFDRLRYDPQASDGVEPDGFVADRYDDLIAYMAAIHEVIPFAYDWRRPLEEEAHRLADAIDAALTARHTSGQPVRILAHASGGLLARAVQLERRQTWELMMARPGARLVMLGTPNGGTWTPMQVLSGDETFGGTLTAATAPFRDAEVRGVMASFPGFLQLQAGLLDRTPNLRDTATWAELAGSDLRAAQEFSAWHAQAMQRDSYQWGVPAQQVLDRAVALRRRLDAQATTELAAFKDRLAIVAGRAPFTPAGYENVPSFTYLDVPGAGDGRVTLESALLPGVPAWAIDCDHGRLPSHRAAFRAYLELLEHGTTTELPRASVQTTRGAVAPTTAAVRSRPSRTSAASRPPERELELFAVQGQDPVGQQASAGSALHVTVVNGDLMFVRQPLLLGHYRAMSLTGTEFVMDRLIGNTMSDALDIGVYPELPGAYQIFMNTRRDPDDAVRLPRPEAVIVVGLGEEGKLNAAALAQTVRQGVIAWAQRVAEKPGAPAVFELAATLVGSGGKGMSAAQSAQIIAEAVRDADHRLALRKWPRVAGLRLIELYLDRATEAWRTLQLQAEASPGLFVIGDTVEVADGALSRPLDSGYRGTTYDFITAITQVDADGHRAISYTLDTRRARTEVTAQKTQGSLIREMVESSSNLDAGAKIGRTLFNVLVPQEIEPFLGDSTEIVIELDKGTAGIPWELLDTTTDARHESEPWAIRTKLVRKLRMSDFRARVTDASTEECALVIGEPKTPATYHRLPGARLEARAVAERLCAPEALGAARVVALISPDDAKSFGPEARAVLAALHDRPWRIVHIAGHGEAPNAKRETRGVVLTNDIFLGPAEVGNMRVVPELVFVNCCHLAARNITELLAPDARPPDGYDRPAFAANVAEDLIRIGVRCVVAAGWAVDDRAASAFATAFYDALLAGNRFMDAVAKARLVARELGGNTWAAYQCYGDPEWRFIRAVQDAQRPPEPATRFVGIASAHTLKLALDTIAVEVRFKKRAPDEQRDGLRYLEERFGHGLGKSGQVAEAFGVAWAELGNAAQAIAWYRSAVAAEDGTASIKAAEQLANQQVRAAARTASQQVQRLTALRGNPEASEDRAAAEAVVDDSRRTILDAITLLETLVAIQPSMERKSLLGSAYKRLALVEATAGREGEEMNAIERMKACYAEAEQLGRDGSVADIFYPALNHLVADLAVHAGTPGWPGLSPLSVETVRNSLAAKVRDDPDFWSVVGETELRLYEALSGGQLATERAQIERELTDLAGRVAATRMWGSVHDNARFLLPKYAARASDDERHAADGILSLLATLAGSA